MFIRMIAATHLLGNRLPYPNAVISMRHARAAIKLPPLLQSFGYPTAKFRVIRPR